MAFPYDWRCAVSKLEERDQYFSRMMTGLEKLHASAGEKVAGPAEPCLRLSLDRALELPPPIV
jgi:hypothetical protein